ncbi:MAG TPA: hypothetical protein VIV11_18540 [Kofleriaceae bacterium]
MGLARYTFAFALGACFSPTPQAGAPCGPGDACPSGLMCIDGFCVTDGSGSGSGSGSNGACVGMPNGMPCGSPAAGECGASDTCMNDACVSNDQPDGSACYDCAAGAKSCATCAQGTCPDGTCTPSGSPRPGLLTSPTGANNLDEGNMFDVMATETITITSFDTNMGGGDTNYEIWTRPGTYVGFDDSSTGWTRVGTASFTSAGGGQFTPIPIFVNVTINAGQRQAFYLTNRALNNHYHNGSQVGATVVSTPELTLYQGAGVNFGSAGFAGINTPRSWEGRIHYRRGGGTTLATPMTGTTTSNGVMFSVTPTRDLELALLGVQLEAGTHDLDIYFRRGAFAGSETTSGQWKLLASAPDVVSAGRFVSTPVATSLGLFLDGGATTSFYVATPTDAELRSEAAGTSASNADLMINPGVTLDGAFTGVGTAVSPNVELGYGTCN